ncbi:receptor-like protein 9DC3 [Lactuca sativa]|uniref:receptor-like protein 9DC3 n=1 Tax=Lactuca sativa TaxID=4236 RepID=UPI001C69216A|nr:receptor-like protein 9DC3 [Lactuca sativa]
MSNSKVLLFFSLFFFFIFVASSSSFNATTHKCSPQQTLDLLLFKQNLSSINFSFGYPPYYSPCQDWLGSHYYYPIMMNWNKNTDCCKWNGVTCNHFTGDVISIDLSCGMLQGSIHPNTTLFRLPHLQTLNLAYNDLTDSQLPHDFSNSLTHLNISRCWVLPTYLDLSSSLKSLDLSYTGLQGKLPDNILNLQYLEKLHLRGNSFVTGPIPKVNMSINVPLKWLHLSFTNLSGEIPDSIGHLKSLSHLGLSSCGLVGSLPKSLVNLKNLTTLNVEGNMLKGTLPSLLFTLPLLENLYLGNNIFTGGLASELFNCRSLKRLSLDNNQLEGEINGGSTSPSIIQLVNLTHLGLSSNNFTGLWELEVLLSSLPNLQLLMLSDSGLSVVSDNSSSYVNPEFSFLGLASCRLNFFSGVIPQCLGDISFSLEYLNLKSNLIQGFFPPLICNLSALTFLDMSDNNFGGVIPQCLGNVISSLLMVDMGNNHFHGTIPNVYEECGQLEGLIFNGNQLQGEIPRSLSKCQYLKVLDLGNNQLNDTFPEWLGDLPMLQVLALKSNKLHGLIETPSTIKSAFPSMRVLDLSHNEFAGHPPREYLRNFNAMKNTVMNSTKPKSFPVGGNYYSVSVVKGLEQVIPQILVDYVILDLSNNKFDGEIPSVIGYLTSLKVLDLSHNSLTGRIPYVLGNLSEIEYLDLSWNKLNGEIPRSLAELKFLRFLNLSQNHLMGRIPSGTQFGTFTNSFGGNPELCGLPLPKKCGHPNE